MEHHTDSGQGQEPLTCISVMICDDLYRDESTKKLIVVGAFNTISVPELPAQHPKMCVLFTLTNGRGEYDLSLTIEHERTGREILCIKGPLLIDDPLAIADVDVRLHGIVFPESGKYWVVLRCDEEIIQQRPFFVVEVDHSDREEHDETDQ